MSTSIYKAEYTCQCGWDYGSCGAKCAVILKSNNTQDTYELYHTDTHSYGEADKVSVVNGVPSCFSDEYLAALSEAIDMQVDNGDTLTDLERSVIFNLKK